MAKLDIKTSLIILCIVVGWCPTLTFCLWFYCSLLQTGVATWGGVLNIDVKPCNNTCLLMLFFGPGIRWAEPSPNRYKWSLVTSSLDIAEGGRLGDCTSQICLCSKITVNTVDGRNPAFTSWGKGSLSYYLQGFIHSKWLCRISEPSTAGILDYFLIGGGFNEGNWSNLTVFLGWLNHQPDSVRCQ